MIRQVQEVTVMFREDQSSLQQVCSLQPEEEATRAVSTETSAPLPQHPPNLRKTQKTPNKADC